MTLLDYIVRLTDQLRSILLAFFHMVAERERLQKGDPMTTRVEVAAAHPPASNGSDYKCDVSTTAASTDTSDTESTTSADTDTLHPPTFPTVDNDVDLVNRLNPLFADCAHYICMMAAGVGLNLPQARLPQPTGFDGTTPPFQEWIQETRNFLSINNYEFI